MLENGDLEAPLNLQNRSLTDEDESCLEAQVPEALEKEPGWRFNEHGLLVGSLLDSRCVDLTVIPKVEESELMRTWVKRGGRWLYGRGVYSQQTLQEPQQQQQQQQIFRRPI